MDMSARNSVKQNINSSIGILNEDMESNIKDLGKSTGINKRRNMINEERQRFHDMIDNVPVGIVELDYSEVKKYINTLESEGEKNMRKYFLDNPNKLIPCLSLTQLIYVNRAMLDIYDVNSGQSLLDIANRRIKKSSTDLWHYGDMLVSFLEGKNHINYELSFLTAKGKRKYLHEEGYLIPDYQNTWSHILFSCVDITRIKEAEDLAKEYQERLEEMVQQLEHAYEIENQLRRKIERDIKTRLHFIEILAHELKTPLTPILSASDYLCSNIDDHAMKLFAHQIYQGASKLSHRVGEFKDLVECEAGVLKLRKQKLDLRLLLTEVYDSYLSVALKRNIALILDLPDKPIKACVDRERIIQVLDNLLENAIRETSSQGQISIGASLQKKRITIYIKDNGRGIEKTKQKYLFKPYQKLYYGGRHLGRLGLGLYICKMLVEAHGGKILCDSDVGRGSTFNFTLNPTFKNYK